MTFEPELLPDDDPAGAGTDHRLLVIFVCLALFAAYVALPRLLRFELPLNVRYTMQTVLAAGVVTVVLVRRPALRHSLWPWVFYGACLVCLPLAIVLGEDAFELAAVPLLVLFLAFILHEYRAVHEGPSLLKPPKS